MEPQVATTGADPKVREYRLRWDGKRQNGEVQLMLEGGQEVKVRVDSLAELAGLGLILDQCPVYVSENNEIYTGVQPVKD
jgi:hypothetical protein